MVSWVVHMFTSKCYTPFTSDLDVMIGAPLSENYRIARCGTMEVATLDGLEAIFMGGAYKHVGMLCKNSKIAKVNTDVQDAPVSAVERRRRRPPPIALPFIYIYHWRIQGGRQGRAPPPPLGVQILSFSCSFRQKIEK